MMQGLLSATAATILLSSTAVGQERATCLYAEPFSGPDMPAGWAVTPAQVALLDQNGDTTGGFTGPWIIGNAEQANAAGYFPVPDEPHGNTFAMANDDAPPCDCAMSDVSLVSPVYDLSTVPAPAVSYRVYHDGLPTNGRAWLDASTDGTVWTTLEEIPAVHNAWQHRLVDLGAFAPGSVQLRFRYDDNGNWSSGMAVDDMCIFTRVADDIALVDAWLGDRTVSPFITDVRSLGYSRIPVEQQEPLLLSARVRNNGLNVATDITVETTITPENGTPVTVGPVVVNALAPLHDTLVTWNTGFVADVAGHVNISLSIFAANADEEPSDNDASLTYEVTAPDVGNHAMALDNDQPSVALGDDGFSVGCRYELNEGQATIHGVSTRFGPGTAPGARVRVVLMNGELNPLHVSSMHTITEEDLQLSFNGGTVYLPLDSVLDVDGPQDVIALVHSPPDSGAVRIMAGGNSPVGANWLIQDPEFIITYPEVTPIVRLHFSSPVTVGVEGPLPAPSPGFAARYDAAMGSIILTGPLLSPTGTTRVFDPNGRLIQQGGAIALSEGRTRIAAVNWPPGLYVVQAATTRGVECVRVAIVP